MLYETYGKTPYDLGYSLQSKFRGGNQAARDLASKIEDDVTLTEEFADFVRGRKECDDDYFAHPDAFVE